jgi:hypothetical protein
MTHVVAGTIDCPNCGAPGMRAYCAECGQKNIPLNPTFRQVFHDFVHDLVDVDGRIFQSLRLLLTRPGFLTRELIEGRRARYATPLRLYLICSVFYFGAAAIVPEGARQSGLRVEVKPSPGESAAELDAQLARRGFSSRDEPRRLANAAILRWIPRAMFVLVPFFGVLVATVMRGRGLHYPQHLQFALHVHAAVLAVAAVGQVGWIVPGRLLGGIVQMFAAVYAIGYLALAFRYAYRTTAAGAIWRTAVIAPLYLATIVAAASAIVIATMPRLFGF